MEEEVLLSMYRKSWDDFLEAFKQKIDQNAAYEKLVKAMIKEFKTQELSQFVSHYTDELKKVKEI